MFTGIVQELGTVRAVARKGGLVHLRIQAPKTAETLQAGESVAVNGVCVTIVRVAQGCVEADVIQETQHLTTLGTLVSGDRVNVERSLTLSDRLNGHLVLGHIDGIGRVLTRHERAGEITLEIRLDRTLGRYVVPKGPLTVDGVSLTVARRPTATRCAVCVIPETRHRTTLGFRRVGEAVNIEIDYVAKLIAQLHGYRDGNRTR